MWLGSSLAVRARAINSEVKRSPSPLVEAPEQTWLCRPPSASALSASATSPGSTFPSWQRLYRIGLETPSSRRASTALACDWRPAQSPADSGPATPEPFWAALPLSERSENLSEAACCFSSLLSSCHARADAQKRGEGPTPVAFQRERGGQTSASVPPESICRRCAAKLSLALSVISERAWRTEVRREGPHRRRWRGLSPRSRPPLPPYHSESVARGCHKILTWRRKGLGATIKGSGWKERDMTAIWAL
eukprot:scaffold536_cov250-Pinguiococcus_pyrenoidosus.AAC.26